MSLRGESIFELITKQSLFLSIIFLVGCSNSLPLPVTQKSEPIVVPSPIQLEDDSGNKLGYAIPLRSEVLVAPDHLLQQNPELFYKEQALQVLARDFRHDVFFFTLPGQRFKPLPTWSTEPPGVGQMLQWDKGQKAAIYSAKAELKIGAQTVQDLMLVETVLSPGDSGRPLYDSDSGLLYGILVGTDSLNGVSYLARADLILQLAEEYLN